MKKMLFLATLLTCMASAPAVFAATPVLSEEGAYAADKPDGTWTKYYATGQKGAVQQYDHGLRVGHWVKWDERGVLIEEGNYKNDKRDGVWPMYFANGKKGAQQEFKEGVRTGHWAKWYDNGQVAEEGSYQNDKLDGTWLRYFPDGQLAAQSQYKDGLREGVWKKWDDPQASTNKSEKGAKLPATPFDLDFEDAPAGKARH